MAVVPPPARGPGMEKRDHIRIRRFITQVILVLLINLPSMSFGLAMGWVSLESGAEGEESGAALVGAAAVTFLAGALAMPLAARAIAAGRKLAMLATSASFIVCWSLKLCGGWGVLAGRAAAGLGGTAAWVTPPLLAVEMCSASVRGAACVALVLAHNVGFLLMYLAADYDIPHRTVLLCCLGLSVIHFIAYMFVPESPAYLAANGKYEEARVSLAWCRGFPAGTASSELDVELKALPQPDLEPVSPFRLAKDMLSEAPRRKAFLIALVAVVGQEMCGVLTLLQFAERVFVLAQEGVGEGQGEGEGARRAASDAVVLGAVQLVASALALYLVEKIGRKPLLVGGAVLTGLSLGAGAAAVWAARGGLALAALAAAVFADSAGLQPAPFALLAEMFTYQYRGCATLLVTAASDLGNAAEIVVFSLLARGAGLAAALAVAAALTLALAAFAAAAVPETQHRTLEQIYEILCPTLTRDPTDIHVEKHDATLGADPTDCNENSKVNNVNEDKDLTIVRTEAIEARLCDENDIEKDHSRHKKHSNSGDINKSGLTELLDGGPGSIESCVSSKTYVSIAPITQNGSEIKPNDQCPSAFFISNDESQIEEDRYIEKTDSDAKMCSMGNSDAILGKEQLNNVSVSTNAAQTGCCSVTECTNM